MGEPVGSGYRGITFMYHVVSNEPLVQWTGPDIDPNVRLLTEKFLVNVFQIAATNKLVGGNAVAPKQNSHAEKIIPFQATETHDLFTDAAAENEMKKVFDGALTNKKGSSSEVAIRWNEIVTDVQSFENKLSTQKKVNPTTNKYSHQSHLKTTTCTKFASPTLKEDVEEAIIGDGDQCRICMYRSSKKNIRLHVHQHFTKFFCICGKNSASRDGVYRHQQGKNLTKCPAKWLSSKYTMYEVSECGYSRFVKCMGWKNPPVFGSCRPGLTGIEQGYVPKNLDASSLSSSDTTAGSHSAAGADSGFLFTPSEDVSYPKDLEVAVQSPQYVPSGEVIVCPDSDSGEEMDVSIDTALTSKSQLAENSPIVTAECIKSEPADMGCVTLTQGFHQTPMESDAAERPPENEISLNESHSFNSLRSTIHTIQYISPTILDDIQAVLAPNGHECAICGYSTSKTKIKVHIRQHFTKFFCSCGHQNPRRKGIYNHQRRTQRSSSCDKMTIYEVDTIGYDTLVLSLRWKNPPALKPFIPCWVGDKPFVPLMNDSSDSNKNSNAAAPSSIEPPLLTSSPAGAPGSPGATGTPGSSSAPGSTGAPGASSAPGSPVIEGNQKTSNASGSPRTPSLLIAEGSPGVAGSSCDPGSPNSVVSIHSDAGKQN